MSMEALQAQEDLMKSIEGFLKKFNRISFGKTPKVLLQAWDNFIEVKHAQPEEVQELLSKLVQDMKIISDSYLSTIKTTGLESPSSSTVMIEDDEDKYHCNHTHFINRGAHTISSNGFEMLRHHLPILSQIARRMMEIVIPEVGRIEDDILLIKDDTLREKLLNVNRLVAKIEALKDNPVPSSVVVTKSTSTFPNLFLEETNTFDNSLPESETFCFNLEEPSSGSPTTHSELSLPDYKAFYIDNDHFKEKSSGSTTTHVDFSQYDSFIFDLSNDHPPADRVIFIMRSRRWTFSHHISTGVCSVFCFKRLSPSWAIYNGVVDIFQESEPRVHVLNVLPTLELDFIPSSESIFAYVVWIFLPFLFIPVIPPYLLSCGDEDTIFDPGISKVSFF
ncbi:hypothetical protein Tco_1294498 [Tanacetum coccineum]